MELDCKNRCKSGKGYALNFFYKIIRFFIIIRVIGNIMTVSDKNHQTP